MSDHVPPVPDVERIDVSVPARSQHLATLRTIAAALGADAGFSIDEIDDLRLAISEVVASVLDSDSEIDADDRIDIQFGTGGAQVTAAISLRGGDAVLALDDLATGILSSVVDSFANADGAVVLVKRAAEAATEPAATSPA